MKDKALLDQKPLVDSYLNQGPRPLSGFSFVSLFAWCDFFDFEIKMVNGCLCIFAHGLAGSFLYLPPLGKGFDPSTADACFKHMARGATPGSANRMENIPEYLLSSFGPDRYNHYAKSPEYVYHKEDLTALKGNAYKSQRHDCNCFVNRQARHSFETYRDDDLDACQDLFDRWAQHRARGSRDDVYKSMIQENRQVHARLLGFREPLGIIARILKADDQIIGYTFGFGIDENTFCVYAEIADWNMTGSAAYMFRSFCRDKELAGYSRINTMDDFAMPNVARAKQAYHPSELIHSYSVTLKKDKK